MAMAPGTNAGQAVRLPNRVADRTGRLHLGNRVAIVHIVQPVCSPVGRGPSSVRELQEARSDIDATSIIAARRTVRDNRICPIGSDPIQTVVADGQLDIYAVASLVEHGRKHQVQVVSTRITRIGMMVDRGIGRIQGVGLQHGLRFEVPEILGLGAADTPFPATWNRR